MKAYKEEDAREVLEEMVRGILDKEKRGVVICFTEDGTMDYVSYNATTVEVRDALLGYARELAVYEGD